MTSQTRISAFDIRLIIALLSGVYGLVLLVLGLFITAEDEIKKSAGVNINLWTGLGLLIVSVLFAVWARLRPIRVPVEQTAVRQGTAEESADEEPTGPH